MSLNRNVYEAILTAKSLSKTEQKFYSNIAALEINVGLLQGSIQFFSLTVGIVPCLISFIYHTVSRYCIKKKMKNPVLFLQVFFFSHCLQDRLYVVTFTR